MNKIICGECEEEITDGDAITSKSGALFCAGCYEAGQDYASTMFIFDPGSEYDADSVIKFDDDFVYSGEDSRLEEVLSKVDWTASDGWRGYTDFKLKPGFVEIADGWLSGYPDDTLGYKMVASDLFDLLTENKVESPVPIYWFFGNTSNVFSQVSKMVVRGSDQEKFDEWLKAVSINEGELKEAFK